MNTTITATTARTNLYRLIEQTHATHIPVTVTGKKHNAVIVSEEDWNAVQETLYLTSIPGMRESIVKGMRAKLTSCEKNIRW